MLTINSYSNFDNIPIMVTIEGTTPKELTMSGLKITYPAVDVTKEIINWSGDLTFWGTKDDYESFGKISYKSHKITIKYGADKSFVGYLLPEVYTMPYTGFRENITINFESMLKQLEREEFNETTNLYSINDLIVKIKNITDITNVTILQAFDESLATIKVYSANFIDDDGKKENYMKILNDICTTFGFKCFLTLSNTLMLVSCELLNGVVEYPSAHYGIDETYSVDKTVDTASVHVSNYSLPEIPTDFTLQGAQLLRNQKPMRIRRGKHYAISKTGNYNIYYRQLYEYQPNQKAWHFNKYSGVSTPVDEFDETKYIINGVPLAGAYPVAWGSISDDGNGNFSGLEQAIWFKFNNGTSKVNNASLNNMMSISLDNFLAQKNTFLGFTGEAAFIAGNGDVNSWDRDWNTNYNADNNATYSSNIDECPVIISPKIGGMYKSRIALSVIVKFTKIEDGAVLYWNGNTANPQWQSTSIANALIADNLTDEFTFGNFSGVNQPSPKLENGTVAIFEDGFSPAWWVRLPATMGKLELSFGGTEMSFAQSVLFRNLTISTSVAKASVSEIDLSSMDVIYSNSDIDRVDTDTTFYMYSDNKYSGRGQLYMNDSDTRLDTLSYQFGSEKPEWHWIRLMTKSFSRAKIYKDIFKISDVKFQYTDRWFFAGEFDLINGTANVSNVSTNMNIGGEL